MLSFSQKESYDFSASSTAKEVTKRNDYTGQALILTEMKNREEEVYKDDELENLEDNDLEENIDKIENIGDVEQKKYNPKVGMLFNSLDEMNAYYKGYGKQEGFPVKRRYSNKGSDGILRYVTFSCGRSGVSKSQSSNVLKPQPSVKNGCKAKFGGCLDEDGKWVVRTVILEHNHGLSPSKAKYFPCNRQISSRVKRQLVINDRAGIRVAQNYRSFVVEAGGHENVSFLEKDCRNLIDKERQLRLGEGDVIAIQRYFLKMQTECDRFFFSMDLDDVGRLKNVFWADPRSRAAYKDFGDIITFDTTYLTNKYDMPFAPFVGVNHHGQSILLGCGLISSEDTETFTWLFQTWLSCMSGSPPMGIITDQDRAMKKAIEIVFPHTRHRWCLWHILKKVPEKLGAYKEYKGIISFLHYIVYDSLSPTIFEKNWHDMIVMYDLGDNGWLSNLYDERYRWVPCFVKYNFWAGMSTTQRSESMNAFFDGYVNSKTTLKQFVEQYDNALRSKVEKECQADAKSFSQLIPCVTPYSMEKQVRDAYTISKFKEFQLELIGKMYCVIRKEAGSKYDVNEDVEDDKVRNFEVTFEKEEVDVRCSCLMFEFRGILCRHAILVLFHNSFRLIPEKYIIARWRKDVRRYQSRVKISYAMWSSTTEQLRYEKMCNAFTEVADKAADDIESYKYVLDWIEKTTKDLPKKIHCGDDETIVTGSGNNNNNMRSATNEIESILDPVPTRGKGRPPSRRKQSTAFKKPRQKKKKILSNTCVGDSHVNGSISSQVDSIIPTQESNVAMLPMFPHHAYRSNIYLPAPNNSYIQPPPLPPYASMLQSWMPCEGSQRENFQQLLLQQDIEDDNNKKL